MKMVNVADILNKTLCFAKYDKQKDIFVENDFNDQLVYDDFPINKHVYWKALRNAPDNFPSWFNGVCKYRSMQTTLIVEEGSRFEHNFSNLIGCTLCCLEDESLALYLAMEDYLNYKNKLDSFFSRDLQLLFPTIDFKEGIPDFMYENRSLFAESINHKIHDVSSTLEKYSDTYDKAKKNDDICFIENLDFKNINMKATYFIFDVWKENDINKDHFSSILKEICQKKNDIFYIGIIAKNANKNNFSKGITDFNNR